MLPNRAPKIDDAIAIIDATLRRHVRSIERLDTGLHHYVYDVVTTLGEQYVVRISNPDVAAAIAGAVYWSRLLRPKSVPLPRLIHGGLDRSISPFQFVIFERLPGTDLGEIYSKLFLAQKQALAADIVGIQKIMHSLPRGDGFGHVYDYDSGFPFSRWQDFILASLARTRSRMPDATASSVTTVDRVQEMMTKFEPYFDSVIPIPFLDDLTTKNVIIDKGALSGIVDVDSVCFGDSLLTVGLTQAALLAEDCDLEYIHAWTDILELSDLQTEVLRFYTALFCVDLISEADQKFRRAAAADSANTRLPRLEKILEALLSDGNAA